jgi:hypothetical protein
MYLTSFRLRRPGLSAAPVEPGTSAWTVAYWIAGVLTCCLWATTTANASTPAVAAGSGHSLLLKTDGTLWAWGRNDLGQLGDGTGVQRSQPVLVGTGVVTIATGDHSSFALKGDGSVWAWGDNSLGQLGDGTKVTRLAPVLVGTGYKALTSNGASSFAVKTDDSWWAWGENYAGQLGDGSKTDRLTPVASNQSFVVASRGTCHGTGLTRFGTLWTWGCSSRYVGGTAGHFILGQRGNGHVNTNSYNDFDPPDFGLALLGDGYVSVSTGMDYNVALKSDGSLWIFGTGDFRDVMAFKSLVPLRVGEGFMVAAQGLHFTAALKTDGSLLTWGANDIGQVGDAGVGGTTCYSGEVFTSPIACRPNPATVGSGFRALALGGQHGIALKTNGSVWVWGGNTYGQLGDGSTSNRNAPVAIDIQVGSAVLGPRVSRSVPANFAEALSTSPLFDASYYRLRNPDAAIAYGGNPANVKEHWLQYGSGERREASVFFDSLWYLQLYPDLVNAFGGDTVNAAIHFQLSGMAEGREASPAFSLPVYKASHPDLVAAFGTDNLAYFRHFTDYGAGECRKASNYFDARYYLVMHADVSAAVRNSCAGALIHWLNNGRSEGRPAVAQQAPLYPR